MINETSTAHLTAEAPTRAQTAIDAVAEAYTEMLLQLDPGFATQLGLPGHETEYRDYSPAGLEALIEPAGEM